MVTMVTLSRHLKAGSKLWVRAFSTTTATGRGVGTSPSSFLASNSDRLDQQKYQSHHHFSYSTTSLTSLAAGTQLDEDLDMALDELLANPFDETTKPKIEKKKPVFGRNRNDYDEDNDDDDDYDEDRSMAAHHMKDSKPVPDTLLVEVSITYDIHPRTMPHACIHTYKQVNPSPSFSNNTLLRFVLIGRPY
jgi:hypothetical protein